ncbi:hypothetical protein [Arenimonas composti]|uniref:Uncharacterized protein n=1 Tax=Arenimonas composti TR7-09 = DSM 18010 TaxID=1121013 RepID=A0A091BDF1_9GAMM|nr:hypothetical protein [Arenimonas composti]KFN50713.1 hypothetical protein P873_06000 [Arenimonas composti TR7-09 = DSM 18010]
MPPLFESNWRIVTGGLGGLAGMVGITGMVFRHIARKAANGPCADDGMVGMEANCALAAGLGDIAAVLLPLAIAFAGAAFLAAFLGWRSEQGRKP